MTAKRTESYFTTTLPGERHSVRIGLAVCVAAFLAAPPDTTSAQTVVFLNINPSCYPDG